MRIFPSNLFSASNRNLLKAFLALIILGFIIVLYNCERDDICSSATPTTPHLIIRFFDIDNQDAGKTVNDLTIFGEGSEIPIYNLADIDSIALPLNIEGEGISTTTKFQFIQDAANNPNIDEIEVTYTPEFVYVSRACGYKSIFNDLQIRIISEGIENWVRLSEIIYSTVDNETEAHVYLFH
ncbi:DUF6452 family protein [Aegicerativicinus sediminis]|uniref:DUF6452 family protein n=1 Tax=Aegicerativicinus sediminis TaxID=2893202 RepID=UPI001E3C7BE4|nr:DUF6452 family protein [Aegicerativicinus sediminis]